MSAIKYYENISEVLKNIRETQESKIQAAGEGMKRVGQMCPVKTVGPFKQFSPEV